MVSNAMQRGVLRSWHQRTHHQRHVRRQLEVQAQQHYVTYLCRTAFGAWCSAQQQWRSQQQHELQADALFRRTWMWRCWHAWTSYHQHCRCKREARAAAMQMRRSSLLRTVWQGWKECASAARQRIQSARLCTTNQAFRRSDLHCCQSGLLLHKQLYGNK